MLQILTVTIQTYFRQIHNVEIKTSNAIELLTTLKEFEQIHLQHKETYQPYRNVDFESILEVIQQDINRITLSHQLYKANGYLLTTATKQYTIESKNKEHTNTAKVKEIASQVLKEVLQPHQPAKKLTKQQHKAADIEANFAKSNLELIKKHTKKPKL